MDYSLLRIRLYHSRGLDLPRSRLRFSPSRVRLENNRGARLLVRPGRRRRLGLLFPPGLFGGQQSGNLGCPEIQHRRLRHRRRHRVEIQAGVRLEPPHLEVGQLGPHPCLQLLFLLSGQPARLLPSHAPLLAQQPREVLARLPAAQVPLEADRGPGSGGGDGSHGSCLLLLPPRLGLRRQRLALLGAAGERWCDELAPLSQLSQLTARDHTSVDQIVELLHSILHLDALPLLPRALQLPQEAVLVIGCRCAGARIVAKHAARHLACQRSYKF
mmetsp:Transcript_29528/g.95266  ORF Transcript_29528/g.95266 Transcript_29528/m.95266 type:complete len:272 (-) Transcript_29528:104-919(-)